MPATPRQELIDWSGADPPHDGPLSGRRPQTAGGWRRRFGGVLPAAALLAAIGVTVPPATSGEHTTFGEHTTPGADAQGASFDALFVQFVDRNHGFALTTTCADDEQPCSYGLAVSTDGGRSFQHRALPLAKIPPSEGYSADLHAVTPQTVVIEDRGQWWVSIDAGRTWQPAPNSTAGNVVGIRGAGRMHTSCADMNCDIRELSVIDPATGTRLKMANVPLERVHASSESTIAADGTRWISGTTQGGDPALATTRDGGRTWSLSRFPQPDKLLAGPRLVVGPESLRYAVFVVQREGAKNGFGPMYRSTDSGRTWTQVRDGEQQPASFLGAVIRPDGSILIGTELDGPMISADRGRTFRKLGTGPALSGFIERSGIVTAMSADGAYYTSVDGGVTWSPVSVPAP